MIIAFSDQALLDLEDIAYYGVTNFGQAASDAYMERLSRSIEYLRQYPMMARAEPE